MGRRATLRLTQGVRGADLAWLWRWQRAARRGAQAAQLSALEGLARYSQQRLQQIAAEHELDFENSQGRLVLLRTAQEQARWQPALQVLRDAGIALREIDASAARRIEPGLSPEAPLAGALHLPDAMAGNCRLFAQLLRQGTQAAGVQFALGTRVARLTSQPMGVQVHGERSARPFDAVVLCAGMASAALLRPLGLRLPMVAVHGYSVSAPLREALHAPVASVVDSLHQITMASRTRRPWRCSRASAA
jgi:D-amino-acid dehydrogenase